MTDKADHPDTTDPSHRQVTVRKDGNCVIIEVTCPDNYDAIQLCEVLAAGVRNGGFRLEFGEMPNG
jgi:hypothetical protein